VGWPEGERKKGEPALTHTATHTKCKRVTAELAHPKECKSGWREGEPKHGAQWGHSKCLF